VMESIGPDKTAIYPENITSSEGLDGMEFVSLWRWVAIVFAVAALAIALNWQTGAW